MPYTQLLTPRLETCVIFSHNERDVIPKNTLSGPREIDFWSIFIVVTLQSNQNEANDVPKLATKSLVSLGDDKCVFLAEMCVFLAPPPYQG